MEQSMSNPSGVVVEKQGQLRSVPVSVIDFREGKAEYRNQQLHMEGGSIVATEAADSQPDLFVTAGMINCHVHWLMDAQPGPLEKWVTDVASNPDEKIESAIAHAEAMLKMGITFACDKGPAGCCAAPVYRGIRQAMANGVAMTHSIFSTFTFMTPGGFGGPYGRSVQTTKELEVAVLELEATRAGVIKLIPEGPYQDESPHYRFLFPEELFRTAREVARSKGLVFAVHSKGEATLKQCIALGADCVEHGVEATPELLLQLQEKGVYLGPTLDGLLCRLEYARRIGQQLESTTYDWERACEMVSKAATLNQGRPFTHMLFASDAGSYATHHASLRELYLMRKNGWQPAAALEAATVNGARCLKQTDRGRVEKGRRADLVFWSRDPLELPLEEWAHLENHIAAVVLNGKLAFHR
jgi:imidazolonepropionase-like amidohydrolase